MDEEDAASTPTASSSGGPEATGATRHRAMPKPSYFAKPVIHAPPVPSATPADASVEAGDQVRSVYFLAGGRCKIAKMVHAKRSHTAVLWKGPP